MRMKTLPKKWREERTKGPKLRLKKNRRRQEEGVHR